jgi:hypothetical protein
MNYRGRFFVVKTHSFTLCEDIIVTTAKAILGATAHSCKKYRQNMLKNPIFFPIQSGKQI